MSYVVICPSIHQPYTDECMATCKMDNVIIVDNTVENKGVPASWNVGLREMKDNDLDWCVFLSAGMRFGPSGGLDFAAVLDAHNGCDPEEFPFIESSNGLGWHFIAVHNKTVDAIGYLDENYSPGYYEDNDYAYRSFLWRGRFGWLKIPVDARMEMVAHGLKFGKVSYNTGQLDRYIAKWGGEPSKETFVTPFGNPELSIKDCP